MNLVSPTRDENFEAFGPVFYPPFFGDRPCPWWLGRRPATTVGGIFGGACYANYI